MVGKDNFTPPTKVKKKNTSGSRRKKGQRGSGRRGQGRGRSRVSPLTTCPGIPGYCSESYPNDVCLVVCARGRNNVPVCQEDGTWTDQPRCSEHSPGNVNQVTDFCPGVPGRYRY